MIVLNTVHLIWVLWCVCERDREIHTLSVIEKLVLVEIVTEKRKRLKFGFAPLSFLFCLTLDLSGPIVLLPGPIHLRCACCFWHWGDKTSRVYIWFPSSLWSTECRYLLKGEFIHVVFMSSLSGRWCSVLGKEDWESRLGYSSPSPLEARTVPLARRRIYGGVLPHPGWVVLLSCIQLYRIKEKTW